MRLIDADKLHYKRVLLIDGTQSAVVVFAKEIDKAEKIRAVPIEWLDRKYEENLTIWKTADTVDESFKASDVAMAIELITELWEKENADVYSE